MIKKSKIKSSNGETILLTGTIDPNFFNKDKNLPNMNVVLTDPSTRLAQYVSAIERYIKESTFCNIVFVENSGFPFCSERIAEMAKSYGKSFEFIYRKLNSREIQLMQMRGKSYGEADLIDYAIKNSSLIKRCESIYKVTGRIFLKNSNAVIKNSRGGEQIFMFA